MKSEDTPVREKTEQELASEFIKAYQEICEKFKMRLVVEPVYISRDDGTFSTVLRQSIGELPDKK